MWSWKKCRLFETVMDFIKARLPLLTETDGKSVEKWARVMPLLVDCTLHTYRTSVRSILSHNSIITPQNTNKVTYALSIYNQWTFIYTLEYETKITIQWTDLFVILLNEGVKLHMQCSCDLWLSLYSLIKTFFLCVTVIVIVHKVDSCLLVCLFVCLQQSVICNLYMAAPCYLEVVASQSSAGTLSECTWEWITRKYSKQRNTQPAATCDWHILVLCCQKCW